MHGRRAGRTSIARARADGDIRFDENTGTLNASDDVSGGQRRAVKNHGGLTPTNDRPKGHLPCRENIAASDGSGDRAASQEDRCRRR